MKKILFLSLLILLCLGLIGCTTVSKSKKLEKQIMELRESLLKKDGEIIRLQDLLKEKERLLTEKNLKIEKLGKKLEGLGVFEK